jgi:hypothetical protein
MMNVGAIDLSYATYEVSLYAYYNPLGDNLKDTFGKG